MTVKDLLKLFQGIDRIGILAGSGRGHEEVQKPADVLLVHVVASLRGAHG